MKYLFLALFWFCLSGSAIAQNYAAVRDSVYELFALGCAEFFESKYDMAELHFQRCLSRDSARIWEVYPFLAQCYHRLGKTEEGHSIFALGQTAISDSVKFSFLKNDLKKWEGLYPEFPPELEKKNGFDPNEADKIPETIKKGRVEYPKVSNSNGGKVLLKALLGEDGGIIKIVVVESVSPEFDNAAISALKQYRFTPALRFGRPIKVWISMPFKFQLN